MTGMIRKVVLGTALAASALAAAAPAEAQYRGGWRGDRHRGIGTGGAAVLGGIVGLGLGAAIASSNNNRYYDRGYYGGPGPRGYYYDRAPRVTYYEDYRPRCYIERQYDRWSGRPYDVRVCT